jgi:hypothetical protein
MIVAALFSFCLSFGTFYDTFVCDEKEVLASAGLSTPCTRCGTVPYPTTNGYVTPQPIIDSAQVWSFVSAPNLHPMKVTINQFDPGTTSGLIFLAPYGFSDSPTYGQQGTLILDNMGTPIWFLPSTSPNIMNTDFRKQTLFGKPVLTYWQGSLATPPAYTNAPGGSSEPGSCFYIRDNTYQIIQMVSARNGFTSDIHEFLITPHNTALFLSTKKVPMDLTSYGGPKNGFIQDFAIQEVDLKTNELIFFWDALKHIPLTDSFEPAASAIESGNVWDVFHLNALGLTDLDTDIVLSGRNTWTIYRIHKPTGQIVWRLGGKQSSFTIESGAEFSWQHDARFFPGNIITMFDDNCCESDTIPPGTPYAHGLTLQLDLINKTASKVAAYYHNPQINVASQGNMQSLKNGNKFMGWGESQYYAEYDATGLQLYDASMPGTNNYTYRAYRSNWVGTPFYPPNLAIRSNIVYASWNGSTETSTWKVFAGPTPLSLKLVATSPKSGFETAIPVADPGPYFQVKAFNAASRLIGESKISKEKKCSTVPMLN